MDRWIDLGVAAKADTLAEAHRPNEVVDEYLLKLHHAGLAELLEALVAGPAWMTDAACHGTDTAAFFPSQGEPSDVAMATCARCPVTTECATYASEHHLRHGIYGGPTGSARRKITSTGKGSP